VSQPWALASPRARGLASGSAAYLIWGLFPLYWPLLEPAGAGEILANRILWSLAFMALVCTARREWSWLPALLRDRRRLGLVTLAAVMIAVNWGLFIWGVNHGEVVETSLGYFMNPLVTMAVGVVVLRERLSPAQWTGAGVATAGVVVIGVGYHSAPWLGLGLAGAFATYGWVKKVIGMPAVQSMTAEGLVLAPFALVALAVLEAGGHAQFGHDPSVTALEVGGGVVTAVPLLLFAFAALRLDLSVLGLLQFLTPVVAFLIGVGVDHEVVDATAWVGFGILWVGLVIVTVATRRAVEPAVPPGEPVAQAR